MILDSYDNEGQIRFAISRFDKKYRKILDMCFYQEQDGIFCKDFPKEYPHIDKVRKNFENHGKKMFDQIGYFSNIPWEEALLSFCQMVEGYDIDWWLVGSCASCLRGIELNPHDVDIMIDSKDVAIISQIFSDYLIEPLVDTKGWMTKDFGVIFFKARIDIASDPVKELDDPLPVDCGPTARDNLETINWRGFPVRIPPIEFQLNSNRIRGRYKRVELIEKYIQIHSHMSRS